MDEAKRRRREFIVIEGGAGQPLDWVRYDAQSECLTIDGVKFAREFFSWFGTLEPGQVLTVHKRGDGIITLAFEKG